MAEPANLDTRHPQTPARRISASISAFQGPLPPPEVLEQYNRILPNGADRIVAWIEGLGMKVPGPFILRVRNQAAQLEQWTREAAIPKEFA